MPAYPPCPTRILDFGEPCSEAGAAPCYINDHWPVPVKPTAPMADTDTGIEVPVPGEECWIEIFLP